MTGLGALRPGRAEIRATLRLAMPVVVVQVGLLTMGVVDTLFVGHVSARDLAAVALGNLYFLSVTILGAGVLLALDPLVSQAVGAGDREAIARSVQRGLLLGTILSVIVAVLLLPSRPILEFLRQPEDVVPVASGYVMASILGVPGFLLFVVVRQTLQSMGRLKPLVWAVILANILNLGLDWILVFGKMGAPVMGAVGAGWASSASRLVLAGGGLILARDSLGQLVWPIAPAVLRVGPLMRMFRLGFPLGVQGGLEFGAFAAAGLLMGLFGTVPMAGHQVALTMASLTFMVPLAVAHASAVLVGREVGRGDAEAMRRAAGAGLVIGTAFMVLAALVFLAAPGLIAAGFSEEAEVIAIAAALLPVAGVFQVFDGLQAVAAGVLRGVGDTRAPMIANLVGFWVLGVPISALLAFRLGGGPVGLWWGLAAGLAAVAAVLLFRVRTRMFRPLRRIDLDRTEPDAGAVGMHSSPDAPAG